MNVLSILTYSLVNSAENIQKQNENSTIITTTNQC